jgi:hypothetical protein
MCAAQKMSQVICYLKKKNRCELAPAAHAYSPKYSGAETKRITVQAQPQEIVHMTLSQKHPTQKRAGKVAQVVECMRP